VLALVLVAMVSEVVAHPEVAALPLLLDHVAHRPRVLGVSVFASSR
jgi:hypothetical protein